MRTRREPHLSLAANISGTPYSALGSPCHAPRHHFRSYQRKQPNTSPNPNPHHTQPPCQTDQPINQLQLKTKKQKLPSFRCSRGLCISAWVAANSSCIFLKRRRFVSPHHETFVLSRGTVNLGDVSCGQTPKSYSCPTLTLRPYHYMVGFGLQKQVQSNHLQEAIQLVQNFEKTAQVAGSNVRKLVVHPMERILDLLGKPRIINFGTQVETSSAVS